MHILTDPVARACHGGPWSWRLEIGCVSGELCLCFSLTRGCTAWLSESGALTIPKKIEMFSPDSWKVWNNLNCEVLWSSLSPKICIRASRHSSSVTESLLALSTHMMDWAGPHKLSSKHRLFSISCTCHSCIISVTCSSQVSKLSSSGPGREFPKNVLSFQYHRLSFRGCKTGCLT